jgi:hypothetical protein
MAKSTAQTVVTGVFALVGIFLFVKFLPTIAAYIKQLLPSGSQQQQPKSSSGGSAGGGSAPSGSNTQGGKGTSLLPEGNYAGGNLVFGGSIPQSIWDLANSYPQEAPPSLADIFDWSPSNLNDNPGANVLDNILSSNPAPPTLAPQDSAGGGDFFGGDYADYYDYGF